MNAFKKNNFNTILIIVLIVMNLASLYFLAFQRSPSNRNKFKKPGRNHEGRAINFLKKELDLTKDQVRDFNQLKSVHFERTNDLRESMNQVRMTLFDNVGNDQFNTDSIIDSLSFYQKEIDKNTFNHFTELRGICDPDQKQKFDELIHKIARNMGPPPARRGPDR